MSDNNNPNGTPPVVSWQVWFEKAFSIASKIIIGVLTWYSIQVLEKINTYSTQMSDMKANQEIMNHDIKTMQRDIDRIFEAIEKLNDKK